MHRQNQPFFLDPLSYTLPILAPALLLRPLSWIAPTSSKLAGDQFSKTLIPPTCTLENFRELFSGDLNFPLLFWNSAYISILITAGQLLTCAMAAFCFGVVRFRGR